MIRFATAFALFASFAFAASTEPAGAPPSDLDPAVAGVLEKEGVRIKDGDKTLMEIWFRESAPTSGPNYAGANVTIENVEHGALMGVIRFPEQGADRRGQIVKPGVYTARLSFFPPDGNHQGVAPQRDFLILSQASADKDPKTAIPYDKLMEMSTEASGTPHPLVLSAWKADKADAKPSITEEGEDWVLRQKIGELPFAVIVKGTYAH